MYGFKRVAATDSNVKIIPVTCPICGQPLLVSKEHTPDLSVPFTHVHFLCHPCTFGGTYYNLRKLALERGEVKPLYDGVFLVEPELFPGMLPWRIADSEYRTIVLSTGHSLLHVLRVLGIPIQVSDGNSTRTMEWRGTVGSGNWFVVEEQADAGVS